MFFFSWIIAGGLLMIVCDPNINRLNVAIMPLIFYIAIGIYCLIENVKFMKFFIPITYIILFSCFILSYFDIIEKQPAVFEHDVKDMIEYVTNVKDKKIYVTNSRIDTYIYFLFYGKINTLDFIDTVEYCTEGRNWEQVKSFNNIYFYLPEKFENSNDNLYVILEDNNYDLNYDEWNVTHIDRFLILEGRNN